MNKYIDSAQFMQASLDSLGQKLKYEEKYHTVKYVSEQYPHLTQKEIEKIINKGIFPYSFLDDLSKLENTTFPEHKEFFNILTQENISDGDYAHAKNVYESLNMSCFK